MKLSNLLNSLCIYLKQMKKERGLLYVIYYISIGFALSIIKKLWQDIKGLKWQYKLLAIIIASLIFYSPSIILLITYLLTGNDYFIGLSIGYVLWWFGPIASPGILVYSTILAAVVEFIKLFTKRGAGGI